MHPQARDSHRSDRSEVEDRGDKGKEGARGIQRNAEENGSQEVARA